MFCATICTLATFFAPAPQDAWSEPTGLHYTVEARDALGVDKKMHLRVSMRIERPDRRTIVKIPVWTPGSYRLRVFPDRIRDVEAVDADGERLTVERLHRDTWEVSTDGVEATVRYAVELQENDRFMLRGRKRRCITYEGPAVYMYLRDHLDVPCHVHFAIPEDWSVASGLHDRGNGRFFAPDYDFLADCPVKIGKFQRFGFDTHGAHVDVVVDGPGDLEFESEEFVGNIRKIVECQAEMFGGLPFDYYVFLYTASPQGGGGGLEHLTSTAIGVRASQLRRSPRTGMSTTAHEFFHAWNVKRIRPIELGPFDYSRPNRTTALWLAEGITSYYTAVTLTRCGMQDEDAFWENMQSQIRRFESAPAKQFVSSADASRTVWESAASDRRLNYYNSGLVLGLLLDIEIRARSGNTRSLDDVMRALFDHCAAVDRGFTDRELVSIVSSVAGSDFGPFFDRHVFGTVTPPYAEILEKAGVMVGAEAREKVAIRGLRDRRRGSGLVYVAPDPGSSEAVVRNSGSVKSLDDQAVATLEEAAAILEAKPDQELSLVLETLSGERTIKVRPTTRRWLRVGNLQLVDAPGEMPLAIRQGIVTGTPGHPGK